MNNFTMNKAGGKGGHRAKTSEPKNVAPRDPESTAVSRDKSHNQTSFEGTRTQDLLVLSAGPAPLDHGLSHNGASQQAILQAYQRRSERLRKAREKDQALRIEIQYQCSTLSSLRAFFIESSGEFIARSAAMKEDVSLRNSIASLEKLHARLRSDCEAQENQSIKISILEEELSRHDLRMRSLEKSLNNATQALCLAPSSDALAGQGEVTAKGDMLGGSVASHSTRQEVMDPALEHYYDCVGNVKVMDERVGMLCWSRDEASTSRNLLIDQDRPPEQSEEDFIQSWQHDIAIAESDFEIAVMAVRLALEACQAQGVDIPPVPDTGSVEETESTQSSRSTLNSEGPSVRRVRARSSETSDAIRDWMSGVSPSGFGTTSETSQTGEGEQPQREIASNLAAHTSEKHIRAIVDKVVLPSSSTEEHINAMVKGPPPVANSSFAKKPQSPGKTQTSLLEEDTMGGIVTTLSTTSSKSRATAKAAMEHLSPRDSQPPRSRRPLAEGRTQVSSDKSPDQKSPAVKEAAESSKNSLVRRK